MTPWTDPQMPLNADGVAAPLEIARVRPLAFTGGKIAEYYEGMREATLSRSPEALNLDETAYRATQAASRASLAHVSLSPLPGTSLTLAQLLNFMHMLGLGARAMRHGETTRVYFGPGIQVIITQSTRNHCHKYIIK
jgi:hypothetical protein